MGTEIERKFLVQGETWRGLEIGQDYCQGYISTQDVGGVSPRHHRTVRVRIAGTMGYLTLKGPVQGISRSEFEYEIPVAEARQMLEELCDRPVIQKVRYKIPVGHHIWELDEFSGDNAGLILAEVELGSESEAFELPDWAGQEVTGDRRYYNSYLVKNPFTTWPQA